MEICADNPADAGASNISIDVLPGVASDQFDTGPRLRIVDDGVSMSATQLHHAVSHGFTTRKKGRYGMVRGPGRSMQRLHASEGVLGASSACGGRVRWTLPPRQRVPRPLTVPTRAQYGYGLQVGAFCNGDALLIGCKTGEGVHVALLSLVRTSL